jgi:hypothetical protein
MTTCKNCNNQFEGLYCNNCGQKNYSDSDKSISSIFKESFHYFTHLEGNFFVTLKTIFIYPGQLSLDYCNGLRKKYFKPISLYLLIIALYLILPLAKGLNPTMHNPDKEIYAGLIKKQIEKKITEKKFTADMFSEKYAHSSTKVSKILLLIFIPFSALLLYLLYYKQKKLAFDLIIFSTEINVFFIITFFFLFPVLLQPIKTLLTSHPEKLPSLILDILFIIYLIIFFKRTFKNSWVKGLLKALIFNISFIIFFTFIYKLLLFEITYLLI